MSGDIEKTIKDLEKYISFSSKSDNFSDLGQWALHKATADKIQILLTDYRKLQKENEKRGNSLRIIRNSLIELRDLLNRKEGLIKYER